MQRYWLDKIGGFSLVPHATHSTPLHMLMS